MKGTDIYITDFNLDIENGTLGSEIQNVQQDTAVVAKDTVPPKPTIQQIRYWRWLREKKLTVDGERYIKPKQDVELTTTLKIERNELELTNKELNVVNSDWLTILFIVATILFATLRMSSSKYMATLFQSLVNYSTSFRMFREKNYTILHGAYRLDILFYFVFSLFLFQVIRYFKLELVDTNLTFYASSLVIVILYLMGKKIIYKVLGSVFEGVSETKEYLFNVDNFNRSLGLVLFPIVALINYYPFESSMFAVFAGIFIVLVFYFFQLQRGISILLKKQFSIFYLFLYLCTLEFLPLLLIYKVVVL